MTVALRLTSRPAGKPAAADATGSPSGPTSMNSSVLNELDFQPQLWLTRKSSGELVKRVRLAPVALAQEMVKYARTSARGSRYGCCGITGGPVAGSVRLPPVFVNGGRLLGRDEGVPTVGETGLDWGVVLRESGSVDEE